MRWGMPDPDLDPDSDDLFDDQTQPHGGYDAEATDAGTQDPPPPQWWQTHPGFAESLIPFWGSAREAAADFNDNNPVGGALNTGLAVSDFALAKSIAGGAIKGGVKIAGSHSWPATRQWLTRQGFADKGQVVHHVFLERNQGIGQIFPEWFKNQPWNLKNMPSAQIHDRMNHAAWGMPQLNMLQQYHYGFPTWFKAGKVSLFGHTVLADQENKLANQ